MLDHREALIACGRGDKAALRSIYEAEAPRMLGVALRMTGRRDLAEDAVQDAFVQIWRKARQFDAETGSARGWVYTILRNRVLNTLRDTGRELAEDPGALEARLELRLVDQAYFGLEEASALRRCLAALEEPKRRVILMAYVLGYSHGEIAGRIRAPLGTTKAWLRRGLIALRECLS